MLPFPRALFPKKGRKNLRIFTIPVLYRKAPVLSSIPRRKKGPENVEKTAGKFKFPHGFFAAFFLISVSYFSSGKRSLYRLVTICSLELKILLVLIDQCRQDNSGKPADNRCQNHKSITIRCGSLFTVPTPESWISIGIKNASRQQCTASLQCWKRIAMAYNL